MASRTKKENIILLPNKDKIPLGKIKDVSKFLNIVSAEYGIEEDMKYFVIEKEKNINVFKLLFIPRTVTYLHSNNAKKFVVYELSRLGFDCVLKMDDDLNKRVSVINNLINTISSTTMETVKCNLNTMLDAPGELDILLDRLITNPQYNSFKFTVLDDSKNSSLLCVNGDGLFIRSLETPFDVIKQLLWPDISAIKSKGTKLIFLKKHEKNDEIICINKKTVSAAHNYLLKYLAFMNKGELSGIKIDRNSWFGTLRQKIRQSFTKRPKTDDTEPNTSYHTSQSKSTSTRYRENAPSNSIVPGSSIVSDDCMDNIGSLIEPSIKTNSTHDVSLGSASSFRPGISSTDQQHQSLVRLSGPDDHISVKTTSTYEVNLDSGTSLRTISSGSKGDYDTSGFGISSFGQSQSKRSPPLVQLKGDLCNKITDDIEEDIIPSVEIMKKSAKIQESKLVVIPPPMIKLPTKTCETQPPFKPVGYYPKFENAISSIPPPLPVRAIELEEYHCLTTDQTYLQDSKSSKKAVADSQKSSEISKDVILEIKKDISEEPEISNNSSFIIPKEIVSTIEEVSNSKEDVNIFKENMISMNSNDPTTQKLLNLSYSNFSDSKQTVPHYLSSSILKDSTGISANYPMVSCEVSRTSTVVYKESEQEFPQTCYDNLTEIESITPIKETQVESMTFDDSKSKPNDIVKSPTKKNEVPKEKIESKLPVSQKKSIPSPKIQRVSRVGSASSSKEAASPTSSQKDIAKEPSPSDKENYHSSVTTNGSHERYPEMDDAEANKSVNFSRFENEEYTLDSKTTITSVSSVGDSVTKKSTKTEISSVKTSGIPTPKQYKTTTTITSTVKKQPEVSKSPVMNASKSSGIPRMASK